MKNITNAQKLSAHIAAKLGLSFEAKNYTELAAFLEEVTPAIDEEFVRGAASFEDFLRGFEDDSPQPYWKIITDKETLKRLLEEFEGQGVFGEVTFYSQEYEVDGDCLEDMPEDGMVVADIEPKGNTADLLPKLRTFSEVTDTAFYFELYNLYPLYEHFTAKLGEDANAILWRIGCGKISTDGGEVVVCDEAEGEYLLLGAWWLKDLEPEELERYGLRVSLRTSQDAPKAWKLRDCGLSEGLRIKYGK